MTHEQRHALKEAVNQARRAQLALHIQKTGSAHRCSSCKTLWDDPNMDCRLCREREHKRRNRQAKRIPCATGCGNTVLPRKESKYHHRWTGMCFDCYHTKCLKCHQPRNEQTVGCKTCSSRHSHRRRSSET